ncbi:glycosyl hydrolase family 61-domain-containing protein [Cantharellus anzutake]|uniref:glycosyl hydrolase family 61-domain-containing protein n=1 Tax=Cantharellus anzutake TaxID=1750568 RepID=UPI001903E9AC|nr:glycosyl hydrolase family 61-domain-containing protein [Cantharellus anzutake]KAF8326887.1 glycosyl hydrolase family 61-domain-containing protein [Cantharellus anzutake]
MKPSLFNILLVFSLFSSALGHGYVESITVGGKTYPGNRPYGKGTTNTPIRQITTVNPITDVASPSMTCGIGAKINTAFLTVHVTAGSDITFHWVSGQGKWGHKTGPILTYLAKCDGDCKSFDPSKATFYKISQTGRKPNSMVWYQEDIENGASYTTKIPKGIPNGNYIIRNEIVALHFANRRDGAQFYPSCSQIRITGGSDAPNLVDVTSTKGAQFPGGYERNGPGIYVPDVYRSKSYTFPGPLLSPSIKQQGTGTLVLHLLRAPVNPPAVLNVLAPNLSSLSLLRHLPSSHLRHHQNTVFGGRPN